jgi:hypothetical protein
VNNSITLKTLCEVDQISARTLTVCEANGWVTLQDVIDYFDKHQSFGALQGVGARTESELNHLCINLDARTVNQLLQDALRRENFFDEVLSTSGEKEQIIDLFFELQLARASVRLNNALAAYFDAVIKLKALISRLRREGTLDVSNIPNIGNRTELEFKMMMENVLAFAQEIIGTEPHQLWKIADSLLLEKKFQSTKIIPSSTIERSIFVYLKLLINEDLLLPFHQVTLLKKYLNVFEGKSAVTLDQMADI